MKPIMKKKALISILAVVLATAPCLYAQVADTVVLATRGDVISNSLPDAANYYVKDIPLGQRDRAKIKAQGNFTPQISSLKFFYGTKKGGSLAGTVVFLKMETEHGPIEVGVVLTPGGTVSNVAVTVATAETKPWIKAAEDAGLMKRLIGLSAASGTNPLQNMSESAMGAMPYFAAQVIATAVIRALVYYNVLFLPRLQSP